MPRARGLLSALVIGALLAGGLTVAAPARAAVPAAAVDHPDGPEKSVPGPGVPAYHPGPDPDEAVNTASHAAPAPAAPAAGTSTEKVLTDPAAAKAPASQGLFVLEEAQAQSTPSVAPGRARLKSGVDVRLRSLGSKTAAAIGGQYVAFQLTPGSADQQGDVRARVDYSGFAAAHGGDYASRLQIVALPACSLTTPDVPGCLTATPLASQNDAGAHEVSAVVPVAAAAPVDRAQVATAAQVFTLAAGASGPKGTYTATDLSPAGSWEAGDQAGSFTYSYPISMPPSVGGDAPQLAFNYDSGSVDGVTLAANGQASWAGQGWDVNPGFIERKFKPCSRDGHTTWGDLCWDSPYSDKSQSAMYISLNGRTTEMIWDSGNQWRAADDSGWRITHKTGITPDNGAVNGEYWVVQDTNGMQYYFGRGSQAGTTRPTNSVGVVPVFGSGAGEPSCTENSENWCRQAYRWQLDYVIDRNENTTTYFYEQEQNRYAIHGDTSRSAYYTRSMNLARVEYGEQYQHETATPPVKVEFNSRARCKEQAVENDPLNNSPAACPSVASSPSSYPDVPTDLICTTTCTSSQSTPTFFTTKRLNDIHAYVRDVANASWDEVWQLQTRMDFPDPGDGSDPSLWLDFLQVRGYVGDDITSPIVNFNGTEMANRFDTAAGVSSQNARRITSIVNEDGGSTDVTYGQPNPCPAGKTSGWDSNTYDCYPAYFDPDGDGSTAPGFGIFNKYVVTKVQNTDLVGGSPAEVWTYGYSGAAWAYSNDILYSQGAGSQTWDQWRGYRTVTVTHGNGDVHTKTVSTYFQGMDFDHNADGSNKSATITDILGVVYTDYQSRKGRLLQSRSYDDAGTEIASTRSTYTSDTHVDGPGIHNSVMVLENGHYTREKITSSGAWRESEVDTTYNSYGLPTQTVDQGDLGVTTDNLCSTIGYATDDPSPGDFHYMLLPNDSVTYSGACGTGVRVAHTTTLYDGATSTSTDVPTDGNATATLTYTADAPNTAVTNRSEATYDDYGRPLTSTDPNQVGQATPKRTTYSYAPATGVPVDGITVTNPAGHVTVTYPSRLRAEPNKVKDANGKYTWYTYDAFDRLTAVWLPTEGGTSTQPTGNPSMRYTYPASFATSSTQTTPVRVLSETLQSGSTYLKSYEFDDGFGRTREVQQPSPYQANTRMITITRYDSRGLVSAQAPAQYNSTAAAGAGLLDPAVGDLTSYVHTDYDALERPTTAIQYGSGVEAWRTTTAYQGDRTVVHPPVGGNTETFNDIFGRTTKVAEYTSSTAHQDTTYAYSYPAGGPRAAITDPAGKVTTFTSNLAGQRVSIVDPNAGTTSLGYDKNGNLTSTTDPSGTVSTTYDALDRPLTRTATPAGGSSTQVGSWTYDPTGALGQLSSTTSTTVTGVSGIGNLVTTESVAGYDGRYRPTGLTTTLGTNTALNALSGKAYTENYAYDSADHVTSTTYPSTGSLPAETVSAGYSDYGLPSTLKSTRGTFTDGIISSTVFTGSGLFDQRTWANGALRNVDWDMTRREPSTLQAYYVSGASNVYWQNDSYTRDADSNVTSITDQVPATQQAQCFTYDQRDRMTQAWTTNPASSPCSTVPADTATTWNTGTAPYRVKWVYGTTNNLTSTSTAAVSGSTSSFTNRTYAYADTAHPAATTSVTPQLASTTGNDSYGYDSSGRMTSRTVSGTATTLGWNPQQQLISTTSGTSKHAFGYDVDGRRTIKITPTSVTAYFGDTEDTVPTSGTGAGTITGTRTYGQDGAGVALRTGGGSLTWLFADLQGSPSLAVSSGTPSSATVSRQRYTPYGAARGAANQLPTNDGWLDQTEDDTTGLTDLNARYYDPALARFISPDPVLGLDTPSTHNPYTYGLGNPETYSDPSGLFIPRGEDTSPGRTHDPRTIDKGPGSHGHTNCCDFTGSSHPHPSGGSSHSKGTSKSGNSAPRKTQGKGNAVSKNLNACTSLFLPCSPTYNFTQPDQQASNGLNWSAWTGEKGCFGVEVVECGTQSLASSDSDPDDEPASSSAGGGDDDALAKLAGEVAREAGKDVEKKLEDEGLARFHNLPAETSPEDWEAGTRQPLPRNYLDQAKADQYMGKVTGWKKPLYVGMQVIVAILRIIRPHGF